MSSAITSPLTVIPCRAGSTEIPQKNFKELLGQPLWQWAVAVAEHLPWPYCISTDEAGMEFFATLDLPVYLSYAHGGAMYPIINEAAAKYPGDPIVILQPTSPFRTADMVRRAVKMLRVVKSDSVVSVEKLPLTFSPDYLCKVVGGRLLPWDDTRKPTKRQDARQAYIRTGDVYAMWRKTIEMGSLYGDHCHPMLIKQGESLSIDTPYDWEQAVLRARKLL